MENTQKSMVSRIKARAIIWIILHLAPIYIATIIVLVILGISPIYSISVVLVSLFFLKKSYLKFQKKEIESWRQNILSEQIDSFTELEKLLRADMLLALNATVESLDGNSVDFDYYDESTDLINNVRRKIGELLDQETHLDHIYKSLV